MESDYNNPTASEDLRRRTLSVNYNRPIIPQMQRMSGARYSMQTFQESHQHRKSSVPALVRQQQQNRSFSARYSSQYSQIPPSYAQLSESSVDTTDTAVDKPTNENPEEVEETILQENYTYLLLALVLVVALCIGGMTITIDFMIEFGIPPTPSSAKAFLNAFYSICALTIVTLTGIFILKFRIDNMLIGFVYMFILVICAIFSAKSIANAIYCLKMDSNITIRDFVKRSNEHHNKLHKFWDSAQKQYSCCGTLEIDRVEDWSHYLDSNDLPSSCCTQEHIETLKRQHKVDHLPESNRQVQKVIKSCGLGLARTRSRGKRFKPFGMFKRIQSGFHIMLTEAEVKRFAVTFGKDKGLIINPQDYLVDHWGIVNQTVSKIPATDSFRHTWKVFYLDKICNTLDYINEMKNEGTLPTEGVGPIDDKGRRACAIRPEVFENDMCYPGDWSINKTAETVGWIRNSKAVYARCLDEGDGYVTNILKDKHEATFTTATTNPTVTVTIPETVNPIRITNKPNITVTTTPISTTTSEPPSTTLSLEHELQNMTISEMFARYPECFQTHDQSPICTTINKVRNNASGRRSKVGKQLRNPDASEGKEKKVIHHHRPSMRGEELCLLRYPEKRSNATVLGRELLLVFDYLTSYIYDMGETYKSPSSNESEPANVTRGTWILWPIPTKFHAGERYPFKLAANLNRIPNTSDEAEANRLAKKMYYLSRGIAENILLKDIIHEKTCESLNEENHPNIKEKLAWDVFKRFRLWGPDANLRNPKEGLGSWFLYFIQQTAWICIGVSIGCIICTFAISVVFWQYYSRIKGEEHANLALPKEFAVLHIQRGPVRRRKAIVLAHLQKKNYMTRMIPPSFYRRYYKVYPENSTV